MKKLILTVFTCILLAACSGEDTRLNNPNLVDLNFVFQIDLNLPQYNNLNFPGNSFVTHNYGINGIVVYNLNNSQYMAFELSDPNHPLRDCSQLEVTGMEASCQCDDGNVYSIITGQPLAGDSEYGLKPYRVVRVGNVLEVSN